METKVYEKIEGDSRVTIEDCTNDKEAIRTLTVKVGDMEGILSLEGQLITDTLSINNSTGRWIKPPVTNWMATYYPIVARIMSPEDRQKWLPNPDILIIKKPEENFTLLDGTKVKFQPRGYLSSGRNPNTLTIEEKGKERENRLYL